jgi:thiol:disulfide interchange protein DsbD
MKQSVAGVLFVLGLCFPASEGKAQPRLTHETAVKSVRATVEPTEVRPGQTVKFTIEIKLRSNEYQTYPLIQPDPLEHASHNTLLFPKGQPYFFTGLVADPPNPKVKIGGEKGELRYYPGGASWTVPVVISPQAPAGELIIKPQQFRYIICDEHNCLPPRSANLEAKVMVSGEPVPIEESLRKEVEAQMSGQEPLWNLEQLKEPKKADEPKKTEEKKDPPQPKETIDGPKPSVPPKNPNAPQPPNAPNSSGEKSMPVKLKAFDGYEAELMTTVPDPLPAPTAGNIVSFVLTAALFGIITLLTPCVFPMVPVTVSVFLKQSEKKGSNALLQAIVYTLTIVIVLGVAALFALGAFQKLSTGAYANYVIAAIFLVFALSLLGMFDLTLPSFLVNFTSSKEGKGGFIGTIFMALTFSLISFTCVAPFLGGFAAMSASGNFTYVELALGAISFAGAFAAPFFFLALFPKMLKSLPKSGDWMTTIKAVMGFLELAAAIKFLRTAELRTLDKPVIMTYDVGLAGFVVISLALGLYLLRVYRLPHDHGSEHGTPHVGVPRLIWALGALGLAVYLAPGLISTAHGERTRPQGTIYAWVDSFLLPDSTPSPGELDWSGDLKGSLFKAYEANEMVFLDFTGKTCTNCKLNEKNVFPLPEVKSLLEKYRRVQLYTDEVPGDLYESTPPQAKREADAEANSRFQEYLTKTIQLPTYVILRPKAGGTAEIVAAYDEGKINDVPRFVEFLKKGLQK